MTPSRCCALSWSRSAELASSRTAPATSATGTSGVSAGSVAADTDESGIWGSWELSASSGGVAVSMSLAESSSGATGVSLSASRKTGTPGFLPGPVNGVFAGQSCPGIDHGTSASLINPHRRLALPGRRPISLPPPMMVTFKPAVQLTSDLITFYWVTMNYEMVQYTTK